MMHHPQSAPEGRTMKNPLIIAAVIAVILIGTVVLANPPFTKSPGMTAGRPQTVDPVTGVIIPAQPAGAR